MVDDIFAKIVSKEIPTKILYEDDDFLVFPDIFPRAPVHVLLITKKSYPTLEDIDMAEAELHGQMLLVARKVAQQLGIAKNYKLHMNVGADIQAVPHVHLHILGGWDKPSPKTDEALEAFIQEAPKQK